MNAPIGPEMTPKSGHLDVHEVSNIEKLARQPLVSVLVITYNHSEYLATAVESIIAQECEFPLEVLIGEDASSDGTLGIALDLQQKYQNLIRVIYGDHNVGPQANSRRIFEASRGHFIAYCEGDDYWSSNKKLSNEIELIVNRPEIGVVHSDWVKTENQNGKWVIGWNRSVFRCTPRRILEGNLFRSFYHPKLLRTCTVLYRREVIEQCHESPLGAKDYGFGDTVKRAYVTSKWRVAYLPEVTAVYRLSPGSVLRSGTRARIRFLRSSLEFDSDAREFFKDRPDYPREYRWEMSFGLLLWAIKFRDFRTIAQAVHDIREHFGPLDFCRCAWSALKLRFWTMRCLYPRTMFDTTRRSGTQAPERGKRR